MTLALETEYKCKSCKPTVRHLLTVSPHVCCVIINQLINTSIYTYIHTYIHNLSYPCKNIRTKLHKTNAAIWYNKVFKHSQPSSHHIHIKVSGSSQRSHNTLKTETQFRIKQELKYFHTSKSKNSTNSCIRFSYNMQHSGRRIEHLSKPTQMKGCNTVWRQYGISVRSHTLYKRRNTRHYRIQLLARTQYSANKISFILEYVNFSHKSVTKQERNILNFRFQ
jgi:hypothetical protein